MKTRKIRWIQLLTACGWIAAVLATAACTHWPGPAGISGARDRTRHFTKSDMDHFAGSIRYQQADAGEHYRLGRFFQRRGRHKLAVTEFSRAIDLDPMRADAYNAVGVSYDRLQQFDLAERSYLRALVLKPGFAAAHNNLGYSFLIQGKPEKAIAHLQKAVSLQGRSTRFHNNLALAYRQAGQKDEDENQSSLAMPDDTPAAPLWVTPRIEIANGNGVHRMARNIGDYFQYKGFDVHRLTNADHFKYPRTRIFYSDGQRQAACTLSRMLFGPDMVCDLIYDGQAYGQIKILMGNDVAALNDLFSGKLKIRVANGNGARDMARKLTDHLRAKGFHVVKPVNAGHFGFEFTQILYPAGRLPNARFLTREFPDSGAGRLVEDDRRSDTIDIIIGKDFTL